MKILVANRGEIAARILATLREMGVESVAVYGPADARSPYVFLADEALALPDDRGFLDIPCLVRLGQQAGATAIHPGYGFVSQSPALVEACCAAGLDFVGPSAASMRLLGDKRASRRLAEAVGVPVIPGAVNCNSLGELQTAVSALGLPVLVKAAGGGGGKGMRRIDSMDQVEPAYRGALREAEGAFGDARLLVEKFIAPARHIEVQIVGDGRQVWALGDRECSLQRRYQKVIEEAPAPTLSADLRRRLHAAACALGERAAYKSLGTVEFLLDQAGAFYFLEVNTRLQVEHPVSELTLGLDLIRLQIDLLRGLSLQAALPERLPVRGHAIEVRLNAEVPEAGFLPASGPILHLHWPQWPGVRIDSGIEAGMHIGVDFDGLLAKLIAWAPSREQARRKLGAALRQLSCLGLQTNQAYLIHLLDSPAFAQGETYTTTLEDNPWTPLPASDVLQAAALALPKASAPGGALAATAPAAHPTDGGGSADPFSPWGQPDLAAAGFAP
jgi:acetyl/propionyl-CoA carboxylase alpha subunit